MNISSFSLKGCSQEKQLQKERAPFQGKNSWNSLKAFGHFPPEPASKIGHPAPFPVELPYRLIQLYTFEEEIVLDPFMGSGQTAIAALKSGRHFVGYEIEEQYVRLAERRIEEFLAKQKPALF